MPAREFHEVRAARGLPSPFDSALHETEWRRSGSAVGAPREGHRVSVVEHARLRELELAVPWSMTPAEAREFLLAFEARGYAVKVGAASMG
jgi:hypothetical protein